MIKKACLVSGVFIAFTSLLVTIAKADVPAAPCSYSVDSPNHEYMFVMRAGQVRYECQGYDTARKKEAEEIKRKYTKSGLYRKGTEEVMWTVNWYAFEVYVANDGQHIVRIGPWSSSVEDEAFSVIYRGDVVKTYFVKDLITSVDNLPHTASHFEWLRKAVIDDKSKSLVVSTEEGQEYVISLETGTITKTTGGRASDFNRDSELSNQRRNPPRCMSFDLLALIAIILITGPKVGGIAVPNLRF
jgi:hypothetical protein